MFQMTCSDCGEVIRSKRLVEVQVIECPHCHNIVGVMNVSAPSRKNRVGLPSSLIKALLAAKDNFRFNKTQILEEQKNRVIDKRLAKLLRRDDFRLDLPYDLYVQVNYEDQKRLAKLLNISPSGAGVQFTDHTRSPQSQSAISSQLPENDAEVSLLLPLPDKAETLSLNGRVIWSAVPPEDTLFPSIPMGVKFTDIDEDKRTCLWDFIASSEESSLEQ